MYNVFTISGHRDQAVYIGYCKDDGTTPLAHFLTGASRSEEERGDVQFLAAHQNDVPSLKWDVIGTCENEWEALLTRNEERATNVFSFTGPTLWPQGAYERAMAEQPDRTTAAIMRWKCRQKKTAREAYAAGLFTYNDLKTVVTPENKAQVAKDLDQLTPDQFVIKYHIQQITSRG